MATNVVTVQEILETAPDLPLELEKKAKSLKDQKPSDSELIEKAKKFTEDLFQSAEADIMFQSAEADISLEDSAAEDEDTIKLMGIFDRIEGNVGQLRIVAKKSLKGLKPNDKKPVVTFWAAVADFLGDVLNWLFKMFNYVLEKIRQGFKIEKDAVSGLFKTIYDFLKNIF